MLSVGREGAKVRAHEHLMADKQCRGSSHEHSKDEMASSRSRKRLKLLRPVLIGKLAPIMAVTIVILGQHTPAGSCRVGGGLGCSEAAHELCVHLAPSQSQRSTLGQAIGSIEGGTVKAVVVAQKGVAKTQAQLFEPVAHRGAARLWNICEGVRMRLPARLKVRQQQQWAGMRQVHGLRTIECNAATQWQLTHIGRPRAIGGPRARAARRRPVGVHARMP